MLQIVPKKTKRYGRGTNGEGSSGTEGICSEGQRYSGFDLYEYSITAKNCLTENLHEHDVLEIIRQMINMGFIVKNYCSSAQLKRDQSMPDRQWNENSN